MRTLSRSKIFRDTVPQFHLLPYRNLIHLGRLSLLIQTYYFHDPLLFILDYFPFQLLFFSSSFLYACKCATISIFRKFSLETSYGTLQSGLCLLPKLKSHWTLHFCFLLLKLNSYYLFPCYFKFHLSFYYKVIWSHL